MKKVLIVAAVMSTLVGCGRIETGNVGVRTDFNKTIVETELQPGWYGAVFTNVDEYSIKEIEVAQNNMNPKAKDNLSLQDLDVSIFYKINPNQVSEMLVKYNGMTYQQPHSGVWLPAYGLVERQSRSVIYQVIGTKYESLTLHQRRTELEDDVKTQLQHDLDASDPNVFTITKVIVRQLTTDKALEESIRAAVKVQKEIEAKNQQVALAEAEAKRQKAEADGIAAANRIISNSITQQLIDMKKAEALKSCAVNANCTMIVGNATPLVNMK